MNSHCAYRRCAKVCEACVALLVLLLLVAQPRAAQAHASLISSDPPNEAVLVAAPASFALTFNETVTPLVMRIIDQRGVALDMSHIEQRGANLVLMPDGILNTGAYILSWRVISADGHPVGGALTFWIGARSAPAPDVVTTSSAPVRSAIWATRLVIYLGLFLGAGGAFFLAWFSPNLRGPRRVISASCVGALIALTLSIGLQGLDALAAPISALGLPALWRTGAQGSFGVSALISAAVLIAALISLLLSPGGAKCLSLLALLGIGATLAASGHAATADPRVVAIASVALHGSSVAFWIGALLPLACALRHRDEALPTVSSFSRAIPFSIAALLASGLLLSFLQLQHVTALWTTNYGRVLIAKLALVSILLLLAVWNRFSLTPAIRAGMDSARARLRISIGYEIVLVVLILGIVGLWRFTPPPRLLAAGPDNFFLHVHTEKVMANVTISPGSAGPVDIVVQLETADERPLTAMDLSITLSNPDLGIEPITARGQRLESGEWRARMTASVPGRWILGLGILISDFDKVNVEAPILVK